MWATVSWRVSPILFGITGRLRALVSSVPSVPGHVFISYRHGDDDSYVQRLADHLTNDGISVWFDREIVTGDRWDHVIRLMIDTCSAFVVVMSPQAEKSDWVAREIEHAELMGRPIFPLLLDGQRFFRLSNLQYENVRGARMPGPSFVALLRATTAGEPLSGTATAPAGAQSAQLSPFGFIGQWWSRPHDLAAAMAVEWTAAGEVLGGPKAMDLVHWLHIEVGDRTFPANLLYRPEPTPAELDESLSEFVAYYAADVRPRFRGEFADAAGIQQMCEHAIDGDEDAAKLINVLTEMVMRSLAKHPCRPRHAGCTGSGCAILASAWAVWMQGRSLLDQTLPKVLAAARTEAPDAMREQLPVISGGTRARGQSKIDAAVEARMVTTILRVVVDPGLADEPYHALSALPPARRPRWWHRLYAQAQAATGLDKAVLCIVLVELAALAAAISDTERILKRRYAAVAIGVVPGILAPALVAGLVGSDNTGTHIAEWLFGAALVLIVVGEVLLLVAMKPATTLRAGAAAVWAGVLAGAIVGAAYPGLLFHNWGWLGYCTCLPVAAVPFWLLTYAEDACRPALAERTRGGSQHPRAPAAWTSLQDQ
jgi:hypothetical protein